MIEALTLPSTSVLNMSIHRIHKIRKIRILTWVVVGSLLAPGVAGAVQARQTDVQRRIVVSPDYLVSRDGDRPHVEIMAAANPRNARNLLAGAITFTRRDGGSATKAYVSRDGGIVWDDVIFPEQREMGGADPQVAFTAAGTALFLTLNTAPDETGRTRAFLHSYRSENEGVTWSDVYNLGGSYDHPMLVADQTTGPFAGRVYVSVLYGGLEYSLGVFRSEDDGRSWIGPVKFIDGAGERGLNVDPMLVFADGAIMVPFIDFPFTPEQTAEWDGSRIWTVVSSDGGVTFSEPRARPSEDDRRRVARGEGGSRAVSRRVVGDVRRGSERAVSGTASTRCGRTTRGGCRGSCWRGRMIGGRPGASRCRWRPTGPGVHSSSRPPWPSIGTAFWG